MAVYYDDYDNSYYNPDDGHDSLDPGSNANWRAIQKGFKDVEGGIEELDNRVTDAEVLVSELAERVTDVEDDLNTLSATVEDLGSRLASAEGTIVDHTNQLTLINNSITEINNEIIELTSRMSDAEADINALRARVTTNEGNIATLINDVDDLNDEIESVKTRVTALEADNTTLKQKVAVIEAEQTQQNSRLTSLENNFTQLLSSINNLNTRVTNAETDIRALDDNKQDKGNYITLNQYSNIDSLSIRYDVVDVTLNNVTAAQAGVMFKGTDDTVTDNGGSILLSPFYFEMSRDYQTGLSFIHLGRNNDLTERKLIMRLIGDTSDFELDLDAVKTQTQKTIRQGTATFPNGSGVPASSDVRLDLSVTVGNLEIGRPYLFIARVMEPEMTPAYASSMGWSILNPVNTFAPSSTSVAQTYKVHFRNWGTDSVPFGTGSSNLRFGINVIAIPI